MLEMIRKAGSIKVEGVYDVATGTSSTSVTLGMLQALPPCRHQLGVLVQAMRLVKRILIHLKLKKAEKSQRIKRLLSNNFIHFFVYHNSANIKVLICRYALTFTNKWPFLFQVDVKDLKEDLKSSKKNNKASYEIDIRKERCSKGRKRC